MTMVNSGLKGLNDRNRRWVNNSKKNNTANKHFHWNNFENLNILNNAFFIGTLVSVLECRSYLLISFPSDLSTLLDAPGLQLEISSLRLHYHF